MIVWRFEHYNAGVIHDDSVILIPSPGEVILIEEPLSWTVNVKSFPTACQVGGGGGDDDDDDDDADLLLAISFLQKGCVHTVGRTPFPSPQHPNAVYCSHTCYSKYR